MNRRAFLLALAALPALAGSASASRLGPWTFLGSRVVRWGGDRDAIHVSARDGRFDHILLKARGNGIFIVDLDVVYSNGAVDHVPLGNHIPQGGQTRVIDLRGANRNIRRVELVYRRPGDFDGPAIVELWGQR